MNSNTWKDKKGCSCTRLCLGRYMDSGSILSRCLHADYIFEDLERVIGLQADFKKGIEPMLLDGRTLEEVKIDFFKYRAVAIIEANNLILNLEQCPKAREIIKDTEHEKIYLEAKEKYLEAINRLLNISDEDILRLEKDNHYEIDLDNSINTSSAIKSVTVIKDVLYIEYRGFFTRSRVIKILNTLKEFINSNNSTDVSEWGSLHVQGFDNSPVSWGLKEHAVIDNDGTNNYTIILKSNGDLSIQKCLSSNRRPKNK